MAIGELETLSDEGDADGIYCLEHAQHMPGGVYFPTRMTLIRLQDGGLWLHSPVPVDDAMADRIDALGPVLHIVAPNHFHHLYVLPALERWPNARLWISPGLENKRKDLPKDATKLSEDEGDGWPAEIERKMIAGAPDMNEFVFFHRISGTLILADLVFNWGPPRGLRQWLLFTIMDIANGLRQSRVWRMITKDPAAAAASCEDIFAWPIRRIVPCHGTILSDATSERLRAAVNRFK